jgi:predicted DCC family thiol-disulfide oxidoreductase YuxK
MSTSGPSQLVFDGDCAFCTSSANWIERRLPPTVVVTPWQRVDLERIGLTEARARAAAYWIDESGQPHRGHRAIGRALVACRRPWPVIGYLCLIPPMSWVAAVVYALVARFRHRLPGGTPACRVS